MLADYPPAMRARAEWLALGSGTALVTWAVGYVRRLPFSGAPAYAVIITTPHQTVGALILAWTARLHLWSRRVAGALLQTGRCENPSPRRERGRGQICQLSLSYGAGGGSSTM
jgi:hypothetical protein